MSNNWTLDLANEIRSAEDGDKIVVDSLAKKDLAIRAANRLGKILIIEVKKDNINFK
jgi:hypothetical protein